MILINLLPQEMRKKETTKLALPNVFDRSFLFAALGAAAALHVLLVAAILYQRAEFAIVRKETSTLGEKVRETTRQRIEIKAIRENLSEAASFTKHDFSWAQILNSITHAVPKGLWLRHFSVDDQARAKKLKEKAKPSSKEKTKDKPTEDLGPAKTLRLEGSVVANGQETATIGRFIKSLKEDPAFNAVFQEVEFFNISQRKIKSFDVYDFTIVCTFKKGKLS